MRSLAGGAATRGAGVTRGGRPPDGAAGTAGAMGGVTAGRALTTGRPAASLGGVGGLAETRTGAEDGVVDAAPRDGPSGVTGDGGTGPKLANTSSGPSKRLFFFFLGLF